MNSLVAASIACSESQYAGHTYCAIGHRRAIPHMWVLTRGQLTILMHGAGQKNLAAQHLYCLTLIAGIYLRDPSSFVPSRAQSEVRATVEFLFSGGAKWPSWG